MDGWVDGWKDGHMDGCRMDDGWMDGGWMDGWVGGEIHRTGSIHVVEYYAAMKRSEALTQAAMWMDLEPTMLSERSQTQKDRHCGIPFTGSVQKR